MDNKTDLTALTDQWEALWQGLDRLFDNLRPSDWQRPHGDDWVVADVPYHLTYYDRDIVIQSIRARERIGHGPDATVILDVDAWNARKFAERLVGQDIEETLEQMQVVRQELRDLTFGLDDDQLGEAVFFPMPGGGIKTVRYALTTGLVHTWNHLTEARLRLRRYHPVPDPAATHTTIDYYVNLLPGMLDPKRTARTKLNMMMSVGGPGGGHWAVLIRDGQCTVAKGRLRRPDVSMSFDDADTCAAMMLGLKNPMSIMMSGKVKFKGLRKMGTLTKLFALPPDQSSFQFAGF